jgi:hypothetical protein
MVGNLKVRPLSTGGAYGEANYARLVDMKLRYDPTNRFRLNGNIPPNG